MLDYKEIMVAQQRCEDMRREAMEANRHRILMGGTQSGPMQRIVKAMTGMKERMARKGTQAQAAGMMHSRAA
jgi:hypothetical protein